MMRKLKVAVFTFGFYTGGTERQLVELLTGIDRKRFTLYVASSRPGGPLTKHLERADISVEDFPLESLHDFNTLRQLRRLRQFLIQNEVDLLHNVSLIGNTFGVLAGLLARVPVIITSRRDMGVMVTQLYRPLQRGLSYCADAIVTNAEAIKQMLIKEERLRADKITVIYNGIDIDRFTIDRSCRAAVRRELGIGEQAPVIGIVAEIKPVKGHIYLLKALSRLIDVIPDLRLLIIGDSFFPHHRAEVEAAVRELGLKNHVIFLGRTQEVPRLLAAIDVSVLPSLSEGISNTILESMAAGVPVVATDVGGNPEIVLDGETGLLVPPTDPDSLATAILRVLSNPDLGRELAANARAMVKSKFSNERMVTSFENFYLQLAEAKNRHGGLAVHMGLRRRLAGV